MMMVDFENSHIGELCKMMDFLEKKLGIEDFPTINKMITSAHKAYLSARG